MKLMTGLFKNRSSMYVIEISHGFINNYAVKYKSLYISIKLKTHTNTKGVSGTIPDYCKQQHKTLSVVEFETDLFKQ